MTYRLECTLCRIDVFRFDRLGDEHIRAMLEHLWAAHPDLLRPPATLPWRSHAGPRPSRIEGCRLR